MEVAQESFVRVHRNIQRFQADTKFYTWIYRITVNLAIDVIRRRKKNQEVEFNTEFQKNITEAQPLSPSRLGVNPAQVYLQKELCEQLEIAMNSLSEKHRTIIVLRELEGLSYSEIAEILDISIGTVMSRLHNARLNLQAALSTYLKTGAHV